MFLFFLLGLLITVYIFNKIYFGKTQVEAIRKESEKTRKIYQKQIPLLIPWVGKEIELLSYHLFQKSERKGFGYSFRGIFTSIYQENMFVFQHKIPFGKSNGFTIVITPNHEIWYDSKNKIYVNGEYLGEIDKKDRFGNKKLKRIFGYLTDKQHHKYDIISEGKETLGSVKDPEDWELPFPRALEVYADLNPHDLVTLKVLACKKIIEIYLAHQQK